MEQIGQSWAISPEQIFFQNFTKRVDFVMREAMMMTTMLLSQRLCYDYDNMLIVASTWLVALNTITMMMMVEPQTAAVRSR